MFYKTQGFHPKTPLGTRRQIQANFNYDFFYLLCSVGCLPAGHVGFSRKKDGKHPAFEHKAAEVGGRAVKGNVFLLRIRFQFKKVFEGTIADTFSAGSKILNIKIVPMDFQPTLFKGGSNIILDNKKEVFSFYWVSAFVGGADILFV